MIDWSVKPPGDQKKGLQAKKEDVIIDYILQYYESERNFRPVLELARSPFYEDLLLTVHDFYFCIWKTSLRDYEAPIFRSSYTQNGSNTCGAFSPTRPGVIFITKTTGIDIWDFVD